MSFNNYYHQLSTELKVKGSNIAYVKKSNKVGGELSGALMLQIGLIEDSDVFLYESTEVSANLITIPDVNAVYNSLFVAGLSSLVTDTLLVNPQCVSTLDANDERLKANVLGPTGIFTFTKGNVVTITEASPRKWLIPEADYAAFKTNAEEVLTTLPSSTQADNYIVWSEEKVGTSQEDWGTYITFASGNKESGIASLMDFTQSWSAGITLVGYNMYSTDRTYVLFSSGDNFIGLRQMTTGTHIYMGTMGLSTGADSVVYATARRLVDGDRLLFQYEMEEMYVWVGRPGFNPVMIEYIGTLSGNVTGLDNTDATFSIGRPNDRSLIYLNCTYNWPIHCGFNNFIALAENGTHGTMKFKLTETERAEYFECAGTAFTDLSFYDDLFAYSELGGDTYPNVVDAKGNLTGGELYNGQATDFRSINSAP